jgi:hypothetical protein
MQLDGVLASADTVPYTSAAAEETGRSLLRFAGQINRYKESSFYQTASLQYPGFETAFHAVQAVQQQINTRLNEPYPPRCRNCRQKPTDRS